MAEKQSRLRVIATTKNQSSFFAGAPIVPEDSWRGEYADPACPSTVPVAKAEPMPQQPSPIKGGGG